MKKAKAEPEYYHCSLCQKKSNNSGTTVTKGQFSTVICPVCLEKLHRVGIVDDNFLGVDMLLEEKQVFGNVSRFYRDMRE